MTDGEVGRDGTAREGETQSVERPTAAEAASFVESAIERGRVVSLVGECELEATGRPGLRPGGRHALVKPDGSVVVHGHRGTAPEVSISGDGGVDAAAVDGALEIRVNGPESGPGTVDRFRFLRVDLLADASLTGRGGAPSSRDRPGADATSHGTLRERVLAEPDLIEPGFRPLSTERETPAGPVDLYGRDAEGRAVVVEIKATRAGPAAVGQLDRYVSALERDLHADAEVRGVLVAPSATDRTRRLLDERGFSFRALSPGESS